MRLNPNAATKRELLKSLFGLPKLSLTAAEEKTLQENTSILSELEFRSLIHDSFTRSSSDNSTAEALLRLYPALSIMTAGVAYLKYRMTHHYDPFEKKWMEWSNAHLNEFVFSAIFNGAINFLKKDQYESDMKKLLSAIDLIPELKTQVLHPKSALHLAFVTYLNSGSYDSHSARKLAWNYVMQFPELRRMSAIQDALQAPRNMAAREASAANAAEIKSRSLVNLSHSLPIKMSRPILIQLLSADSELSESDIANLKQRYGKIILEDNELRLALEQHATKNITLALIDAFPELLNSESVRDRLVSKISEDSSYWEWAVSHNQKTLLQRAVELVFTKHHSEWGIERMLEKVAKDPELLKLLHQDGSIVQEAFIKLLKRPLDRRATSKYKSIPNPRHASGYIHFEVDMAEAAWKLLETLPALRKRPAIAAAVAWGEKNGRIGAVKVAHSEAVLRKTQLLAELATRPTASIAIPLLRELMQLRGILNSSVITPDDFATLRPYYRTLVQHDIRGGGEFLSRDLAEFENPKDRLPAISASESDCGASLGVAK